MNTLNKIPSWLISGVLLGLSYPSFDTVPTGILAWFAFVPFLLSIRHTTSFKQWAWQSLLVFVVSTTVNNWWVAYFSWQALAVCYITQNPFMALPFLVFYGLYKNTTWRTALLLFPVVWTLNDWFLHVLPHGLQVYLLPYTQANHIWLIQFIDVFGMWGVSFWVVMMNVLIVLLIEKKSVLRGAFTIIWLVVPLMYSWFCLTLSPKSVVGRSNVYSKVSIIQTNLDSYATDSAIVQKTFNEIVSLSDSAVRTSQPDLLVLPEGAIPIPLFQDRDLLDFTKNAIANWQTSVAIGFVEYPDSTKKHVFLNNAIVFTPQLAVYWDSLKIKPENVKVYQKRYGLPFVELMPYFENIPTPRGSAMQRGTVPYTFDYGNLTGEKFRVALSICWEQTYPKRITDLVKDGAEFVALMNNDAWFGTTPGAKHLMSFTRMRAIENRRSIVRCSNGGISCFIDPFGKIEKRLPWFTAAYSTHEVLCVNKRSFYTKHPEWFLSVLAVVFGIAMIYLVKKRI